MTVSSTPILLEHLDSLQSLPGELQALEAAYNIYCEVNEGQQGALEGLKHSTIKRTGFVWHTVVFQIKRWQGISHKIHSEGHNQHFLKKEGEKKAGRQEGNWCVRRTEDN